MKNATQPLPLRWLKGIALGVLATTIAHISFAETAPSDSVAALRQRVQQLTSQLQEAKSQLKASEQKRAAAEKEAKSAKSSEDAKAKLHRILAKPTLGPFTFGGAIRANYVLGDYNGSSGPSRGGHGGNMSLDTFRINVGLHDGNLIGAMEYRWYNGYNFFHNIWLGYKLDDGSTIKVGLNRAPFGPGPYGVSQSWFFDQHYYVGLSDNMDLGIKYTKKINNLSLDLAYYYSSAWNGRGTSNQSARYSYDIVNEYGGGFEERNQFNFRAIYALKVSDDFTSHIGTSLQIGQLKSMGSQSNGTSYAASVHAVNDFENWKLAMQLTYYDYDINRSDSLGTSDLITMGAYDYAYPVAAKGIIPAISLSYHLQTNNLPWLDYVVPYIEYSSILKHHGQGTSADSNFGYATGNAFNNSDLFVLGAAWAHNGWYIYTDLAYSNGNYFVGNRHFTTFGSNPDNAWQYRLNINFGYYF